MKNRKPLVGLCAVVFMVCGAVTNELSAQVVVPNAWQYTDAPSANSFPFDCGFSPGLSLRYQQVYRGSEVGFGWIGQVAFRQDAPYSPLAFDVTLPGVTITLSSTDKEPDALSPYFAQNIGADVVVVSSGDLRLTSADCNQSPCEFDIVVPLTPAFRFDSSSNANLLLDITIPACHDGQYWGGLDTVAEDGDSVSRVVAQDYTATWGPIQGTSGAVTRFILGVFIDGFESGDLSNWSDAVGGL